MGSVAVLLLERLVIDEQKFSSAPFLYRNFSPLFQPTDLTSTVRDIGNGETINWPIVKKPLRQVSDRLDLLGFNLPWIERRVADLLKECIGHAEIDNAARPDGLISAVDVISALTRIDADAERAHGHDGLQYYFWYVQLDRLNEVYGLNSDCGFFKPLLGQLEFEASLRLLAANASNTDSDLIWDIGQGSGDYFEPGALPQQIDSTQQFLIVTEGRSDIAVLDKALQHRRGHIRDFFSFTNMSDGYPFGGIGNLLNFTKGLAAIKVQNRTIVIFDNDAEGRSKYEDAIALNLPSNIRAMHLPNLLVENTVTAVGPHGEAPADVNSTAAAIEVYLDLASVNRPPRIRWKNYVERIDKYQGELERKNEYAQAFLDWSPASAAYDFTKLDLCLRAIVDVAVDIASIHRDAAEAHDFDWLFD